MSYHQALTQPGQPLAGLEALDIHSLASLDLDSFDLLLVLRSVDNEQLWTRRHQIARFLDRGGVLVSFGEAWTNWFPGCRWHPEHAEDLLPPVIVDHSFLADIAADALHWHATGPRWCNHGHFAPPPKAEVLVANQEGGAWHYIDRATTNGVIMAATNLDLDTHAYYGNTTAGELLRRVLVWADEEIARSPERRERALPKIAGLFSGVNFQRGFYTSREFRDCFAIVSVEELAGIELTSYAAVWIPRESNQGMLLRHRARLEAYLAAGGALVSFDEVNQPWLPGLAWEPRAVDMATATACAHPIVDGFDLTRAPWHAHGVLTPPPDAAILLQEKGGGALLSLDERTNAPGRVLAGTIDPDCHAGYGSDVTRPLPRAILRWLFADRQRPEALLQQEVVPPRPAHRAGRPLGGGVGG